MSRSWLLLLFCLGSATSGESHEAELFNPKQIQGLILFVESTRGMAVATHKHQKLYDLNTELVPLEKTWSDQTRFPHGTVRWWEDQSPYQRSMKTLSQKPNTEFKTGRDFGQDDHDRPGYLPEACQGKPAARGGLIPTDVKADPSRKHHSQPCYFEIQYGQGFEGDVPYSIFLVARPVSQKHDFVYFGTYFWACLTHQLDDNSLAFRNGGKNWSRISSPESVELERWQLLEIHREDRDRLRCLVNEKERTFGTPTFDGPMRISFLMNNNKGQSIPEPMAGDVSAFVVYERLLTEDQQQQVRGYFNRIYSLWPEKSDSE